MTTFARTPNGDIEIPRVLLTDPDQVCLQTVRDGLALWKGEWFLDTALGYPWTVLFGQKIVNTGQFIAIMQQFLLSCIGIVSANVTASFNGTTRAFSYFFSALMSSGAVLTGGTNQPFTYTPGGTN